MSLGDRKLKLLVVDDELDNLDLLYRMFRWDFKVYKVDSVFIVMDVLKVEGEMVFIIFD